MNLRVDHTDDRNLTIKLELPHDKVPFYTVTLRGKHSVLLDQAQAPTREEADRIADAMLAKMCSHCGAHAVVTQDRDGTPCTFCVHCGHEPEE